MFSVNILKTSALKSHSDGGIARHVKYLSIQLFKEKEEKDEQVRSFAQTVAEEGDNAA